MTWLVTFPRSGSTWLELMLRDVAKRMGKKLRLETHHDGGAIWKTKTNKKSKRKKDEFFKTERVLLMIRDPRDTVSSLYFFVKFRHGFKYKWVFNKSIFIRSQKGLFIAVWHLNEWSRKIHAAKESSIIRFEHLAGIDGARYFKRVCKFVGLNVSEEQANNVFKKWTPDKVERWESRKCKLDMYHNSKRFKNRDLIFNERFCRRSKPGAAFEDLSEDDLRWMDQYIEENLSDDYKFYKYDSRRRREGISTPV